MRVQDTRLESCAVELHIELAGAFCWRHNVDTLDVELVRDLRRAVSMRNSPTRFMSPVQVKFGQMSRKR